MYKNIDDMQHLAEVYSVHLSKCDLVALERLCPFNQRLLKVKKTEYLPLAEYIM